MTVQRGATKRMNKWKTSHPGEENFPASGHVHTASIPVNPPSFSCTIQVYIHGQHDKPPAPPSKQQRESYLSRRTSRRVNNV